MKRAFYEDISAMAQMLRNIPSDVMKETMRMLVDHFKYMAMRVLFHIFMY